MAEEKVLSSLSPASAEEQAMREVQAADEKRKQQIVDERMKSEEIFDEILEEDERNKSGNHMDYQIDRMATHFQTLFTEAEQNRKAIEARWLKDLKQVKGEYEPEVLARIHPKRSKAFIRYTRAKVKTTVARLMDFLFPANGDKNWGIEPTPIPELSPEQMTTLVTQYMQQTGQEITPIQLRKLIFDTANSSSDNMERAIADQLSQLHYRDIMKEVVTSGATYGTGVLKGPLITVKRREKYVQNEDSSWALLNIEQINPFCEAVAIWDFFPDMTAKKIDNCRYIFQRHIMDKHKLHELAKRPDFNGEAIKAYLDYKVWGDHENKDFESEIDSMGQNTTLNSSITKDRKYEVLEFWGYVDNHDMEEMGAEIPDNYKGSLQVKANIWILGDKIIKATPTPLDGADWPYYLYYYDKDESSIFGEGLPTILRDIQELINSGFRVMLDNAAISAGPQIEANMDLLGPDEDPTQVYPFKVWLRNGTGLEAQQPAIRVHQLPSYTSEFIAMSNLFERYGEEVSTMPRVINPTGAANLGGSQRTQGGLSMLMGQANITIKDQVKNFDDGITSPFITAMYYWNMEFNEDPSIKGD